MNKKLLLILYTILFANNIHANTFSKSKNILLKKVYFDNQYTFYCGNPYEVKQINGKERTLIVQDEKFYTPRNEFTKKGKINERALRVEWEHIVPAHNFGKHLPCWQKGGRKACQKDPTFRKMEADMYNLVPAIGEVNGDRSNFKFAANSPKVGMYGVCKMQIDFKNKRAFIKDDIKGDIARAYLYMSETYNMRLSSQEKKLFEAWNKQDPLCEWEIKRNERIARYQL